MTHSNAFDDLASLDPIQLQPTTTPMTNTQTHSAQRDSKRPTPTTSANDSYVSPHTATNDKEDYIDRFASLFLPSAPRASPELNPTPLPPTKEPSSSNTAQREASHAYKPQHNRTASTSSQLSDFGAFVSVSAFDDPLSSLSAVDMYDFGDGLQEPMIATPTNVSLFDDSASSSYFQPPRRPASRSSEASPSSRSTSRSNVQRQPSKSNPTLSFFDQFASDARERSSVTRSLVLDELLLHEDDPLYFLKDQNSAQDLDEKGLPKTPSTAATLTPTPLTATMPLSPPPPLPPPKSPQHASKPGTPQPPSPMPLLPLAPLLSNTLQPSSSSTSSETIAAQASADPPNPNPNAPRALVPVTAAPAQTQTRETTHYLNPAFNIHHDLDHDYFRTPPPPDPPATAGLINQGHHSTHPSPALTPFPHILHANPYPHHPTPRRSGSLLVPGPTLAEPVTSALGAVRSPDTSASLVFQTPAVPVQGGQLTSSPPLMGLQEEAGDQPQGQEGHDEHEGRERSGSGSGFLPIPLPRSQSYSSLSGSLGSLPTKWMSSLLRGGGGPQGQGSTSSNPGANGGGQARPALESIFSQDEAASSSHAHSPPHDQQQHTHGWRSSYPQHTQTIPTFSHSSAFAPSIPPAASSSFSSPGYLSGGSGSRMSLTSGPSPFAPHVYVPPSGAPGYTGESYGWDKGFSEELEAERRRETQPQPESKEGCAEEDRNFEETQQAQMASAAGRNVKGAGSSERERARERGIGRERNRGVEVKNGHGRRGGGGGPAARSNDESGGGGWGFGFGSVRVKSGFVTPNPKTRSGDKRTAPDGGPRGGGEASAYGREFTDEDDSRNGRRPEEGREDSGMGDFIERKAGNVELVGRREASTPVLMPELAGKLRSYLPALSRLPKKWTLIYSLDQHGISLNTLYTRCEAHATRKPAPGEIMANNAAMLVVLKDADGAIFGAWLAEGVRHIKGGKGYYGGGESFLWKYSDDTLTVYKTTGKNNYIAHCEPEYISFGGGDGHYGLYLDDTLFDGSSAPCPTFDNEPLCSPGLKKGVSVAFECVGLEVWGMGP